ncbi:hypothetical protein OJF2_59560 [Aquisphaera giovannonii]|uniref:Lipoprotein n=1 Tax=Aquisphaera giovannonii TaxID=406548 RepID=A0A5B9WA11_9BACT|nr:hypothetical protein [Aquisphaera giovannonii]QEH37366.1 hypothetical protein OJF2_59560 [Aquisphaera giovannonii]
MHTRRRACARAVALYAVLLAAAGCGGDASPHRSPTSEDDPARHEAAVKAAQSKAIADREAEAKAMRRSRRAAPSL